MPRRLKVTDINPHVKCTLCNGYLVDATAIIECLHAFCRTCIVHYLKDSKFCPVCDVQVHKTKPLCSIRSDQTLQDLVYKMVPGLYQNEMKRRRDFYRQHQETRVSTEPELRGEEQPRFFSPKESISLSLHHRPKDCKLAEISQDKDPTTRHLSCPAAFTVGHLKKFIHLKFSLPSTYAVDIFYEDQLLRESYTLMDVAYIYSWKRAEPMKFFYSISKYIPKIIEPIPAVPPPATQEMETDCVKCDTAVSDSVSETQTTSKDEIETMQVDNELPRPEEDEKIDKNISPCPSPTALPPSPPLSEKELAVSSENIISPSSDDAQPMDTTETEVVNSHSSLPEQPVDETLVSEPSCDNVTITSSVLEILCENVAASDPVTEPSNTTTDVLPPVAEHCKNVISSSIETEPLSSCVTSQSSIPISTCNNVLISSPVPQTSYNSIAISTPVPEPTYSSMTIASVPEPTYNSVKLVSTPEGDPVLSPTNGFKLKFIKDPELQKSRSKKSGRKARSSRHKNVPVRLARLAPYPPPAPPPVPVTCLTTQHLPQFAVGKLVPSVITTLASSFVSALVSTTTNSLCNISNDSSASQVSSVLNQQSIVTSNISSHSNGIIPSVSCSTESDSSTSSKNTTSIAAIPSTASTSFTLATAQQDSQIPADTKELSCTETATENNVVVSASVHLKPETLSENMVVNSELPPINTLSVSFSTSDPKVSNLFVNSFNSPIAPSSILQTDNQTSKATSSSLSSTDAGPSKIVSSTSTDIMLNVNGNLTNGVASDSPPSSSFIKEQPQTIESVKNGEEKHLQTLTNKDSIFEKVDKNSESFMQSVKNSISAEFSDNDDLGCPPDLVVDEQKMDSSDNEDDTDAALRKKINAIAEKEDEADVTDDTEADSGRASDMSCPARCEEDVGSPATTETITSSAVTLSVNTSSTSSSTDVRHTKSNNIDHVIKQLYLQHEIGRPPSSPKPPPTPKPPVSPVPPKDDTGGLDRVLDLSTCTRKSGEIQSVRSKPVANPVMDIKHRKQPYLPAPAKQHTACPPAPKHPTSPLLLHQLTTRHTNPSILQAQLTGNTKSYTNHPQTISYVNPGVTYALHGSRNVSSPSSLPVRPSQPTYSYSYSQYSGMLPYPMMDISGYAARSSMISNMSPRSTPNSLPKEVSLASSPSSTKTLSFASHSKVSSSTSRRLSDTHVSSSVPLSPIGHCRVPNLPSPLNPAHHPRTSPSIMSRMSPHHRSASPAPSPQHVSHSFTMSSLTPTTVASPSTTTTTSQCKPSVPIYKKSESSHKGFKLKKNANLTVFNPDPNGFSKLVIKNLDSRSIKNTDSRSNNHHK